MTSRERSGAREVSGGCEAREGRTLVSRGEGAEPDVALLGLAPAVAAGLLAFNVFYLRRQHPGLISGKLSDLSASFLLPIFLVSVAGVVRWWLRGLKMPLAPGVGRRGIWVACGVGAVYFALLKGWAPFTRVHQELLGWLDVPFGGGRRFRNLADPTDLVALVMYPLAGLYLERRAKRGASSAERR